MHLQLDDRLVLGQLWPYINKIIIMGVLITMSYQKKRIELIT